MVLALWLGLGGDFLLLVGCFSLGCVVTLS